MAYNISKISKEFIGLFSSDNVGQIISNITEYALQSTDKSKLKSLKKDLEKFIDSNKYQRNPIKDDEGDIIDWEHNGLSNIDTRELNKKVVYVDSLIAILDENKKVNIKRTSKKTLPKIDASNNVPSVSSVNEVKSSNILPKSTKEVKSISTLKQIHNKTSWSQTPNNLYSGFGGGGDGTRGPENPDPPNDPLLIAILALTSEVKSLSTSVSKINKESSSAQRRTRDQAQEEKLRKIAIEEQREKRLSNESESRLRKVDKDRELEEKKLALKAQELSIKEGQKEHNKKLETIRLMESSEKTKRAVIENEKHKRETNKEKYTTKRYYDFLSTPEGQKLERSKIRAQKEMRKMDIGFKNQELEFKKAHLDYRKFIDGERKLEREKLRIDRLKEKQRKEQEKLQKQEEAKRNKRRDDIVGAFGKEDASFGAVARGAFWLHDRLKGKSENIQKIQSDSSILDSVLGGLAGGTGGAAITRVVLSILPAIVAGASAFLLPAIAGASVGYVANRLFNNYKTFKLSDEQQNDKKNSLMYNPLDSGYGFNKSPSVMKGKSGQSAPTTRSPNNTFYSSMYDKIYNEASRRGIQNPEQIAKIGAAQATLESDHGTKPSGKNNFFGIKGKGSLVSTHEMINGKSVKVQDRFKDFESLDAGVSGYLDLLQKNSRYQQVLKANNIDDKLKSLQSSGYATDTNYSDKIKSIINSNKLLDTQIKLDSTKSEKDKAPMPVNVINQSQGAPVNNTTIINNAPDTDPTIKKISYFNMYPNRVV